MEPLQDLSYLKQLFGWFWISVTSQKGKQSKRTLRQIKTQHSGIVELIRVFTSSALPVLAPEATTALSCLVARPDDL